MTNMQRNIIGSKYEGTRDLDIAVVAKMIRADIKQAVKAGELPQSLKTSLRISRYAGGQSLNVEVKSRVEPTDRGDVGDKLKAIVEAYNYDNSDVLSDYFSVRFYGHVQFDYDVNRGADALKAVL